ncbi:DNA-deoxyinosine glycosylase [Oscillospiraceae bacterium PP1C4]
MIAERITHTIEPVYNQNSRVLILGTLPSPKSREFGFYYGHPQNRFWRVMAAVLGKPLPQTNDEKRTLMLQNGIALWDVLHACVIEGAEDASIKAPEPNDLTPILQTADIRAVFTTGAKAASLYKKYLQSTTGIAPILLPSTSPANCARSLDSLVEAYGIIKTYLEDSLWKK